MRVAVPLRASVDWSSVRNHRNQMDEDFFNHVPPNAISSSSRDIISQKQLRGFTLRSPWLASAMLHGWKTLENRSQDWASGWYAVHVGVGKEDPWCEKHVRENVNDKESMEKIEEDVRMGRIPRGHIAGLVHIQYSLPVKEARDSRAGGWAIGPFCMVISHLVFLKKPVEARGQLGAWGLKGDLRMRVLGQLGNAIRICESPGVFPNSRTMREYKEQLLLSKREQQQSKNAEKRKHEGGHSNCTKSKLAAFDKD